MDDYDYVMYGRVFKFTVEEKTDKMYVNWKIYVNNFFVGLY